MQSDVTRSKRKVSPVGYIKKERDSSIGSAEPWLGVIGSILSLSGDVTASGPGSATATVNSIQGHLITYGTAAPASGTWSKADRCYNSSPTVGQPKSWVCTVAGTPGTWVSEGNL